MRQAQSLDTACAKEAPPQRRSDTHRGIPWPAALPARRSQGTTRSRYSAASFHHGQLAKSLASQDIAGAVHAGGKSLQ